MDIRLTEVRNLDDIAALQMVFKSAIETIASKDYSEGEISQWLRSTENDERWVKLIRDQHVLKAMIEEEVVGFGSLKDGDYLDFMYVHGDHLRRGIAQKLLDALIDLAVNGGANRVTSDVSFTAKPFFEKNGFTVVQKNNNQRGSEVLVNFKMSKSLV